jgi:hypothetical protein
MRDLENFVHDYDGEVATIKAVKGHRTKDIQRFLVMRKCTTQERSEAKTIGLVDEDQDEEEAAKEVIRSVSPFQFRYPKDSAEVKVESSSKKRQAEGKQKMVINSSCTSNTSAMMTLDDDTFDFSQGLWGAI